MAELRAFTRAGEAGMGRLHDVYAGILRHFGVTRPDEQRRALARVGLIAVGPKRLARLRPASWREACEALPRGPEPEGEPMT